MNIPILRFQDVFDVAVCKEAKTRVIYWESVNIGGPVEFLIPFRLRHLDTQEVAHVQRGLVLEWCYSFCFIKRANEMF